MCSKTYKIIATEKFKKDLEYYETKKGYKSIENDVGEVLTEIVKGNLVGEAIKRFKMY